jgi:hypothetical protein
MKLPTLPDWIKEMPARMREAFFAGAKACWEILITVGRWVIAFALKLLQFLLKALSFCWSIFLAVLFWILRLVGAVILAILAGAYRYGPSGILFLIGLAALAAIIWVFVFEFDAAHWLTVDSSHDSSHANLYYVVTIVCLPLQTLLLLIAGLYAWRTLRQNLQFKQRDVEQQCVDDYLAIHEQMREAATDTDKIEASVRKYWIHMIYEFYWWRRGLISSRLYRIWTEFREREFRTNLSYYPVGHVFPPNQASPIKTFVDGYEFCRNNYVFRKNTDFVKFMDYLLERSKKPERHLWWFQLEPFRHQSLGGWF